MEVRQYTEFSDIPLDEARWDSLVSANQTDSVFMRYRWMRLWWKHFGGKYRLRFLVAEEDGEIIGFAPLMLDNNGCIRFIGDDNADYLDFVAPRRREEVLVSILSCLYRNKGDWNTVELKNITASPELLELMPSACNTAGLIFWDKYSIEAPSLVIRGNEENARKLLRKYSIRRTEKRFKKTGELEYRVMRDPAEARVFWEAFFDQHVRRCSSVGRNSAFRDPVYRDFIAELFNSDTDSSYVHFSVILLNGKAIAFHFGFISGDRLLWYKPCFDVDVRKGSPGILLIRYLIEYVLEHGLHELDFTIGAEMFKDRFCNVRRQVHTVRIYQAASRYYSDYVYDRLRCAARNLLRVVGRRPGSASC